MRVPDVGVALHHLESLVAQHGGDLTGAPSLHGEIGRSGVSQIMEPEVLDGRELYGVTFDVYELVLAVRLTVPAPSTHVHTVKRTCTHARTHDTEIHKNIRCG